MALSMREQLLAAIETRLATLTPGSIGRGQYVGGALPAIQVWDTIETASHRSSSVVCRLNLGIEYVAKWTDNSQPNALLAEVIRVMGETDPTFGGLAETCRYTGCSIEYPDSGGDLVGIRSTFEVGYVFQAGDPYAQP